MSYKARTFCSQTNCADFETCDRALTDAVMFAAGDTPMIMTKFTDCYKAPVRRVVARESADYGRLVALLDAGHCVPCFAVDGDGRAHVGVADTHDGHYMLFSGLKMLDDKATAAGFKMACEGKGLRFMDYTCDYLDRIAALERAIRETLAENAHLADGEDCTLRKLVKVMEE